MSTIIDSSPFSESLIFPAAFEPVTDGTKSRCFITSSYDASSHFEETTNEARSLPLPLPPRAP